MHPLRLQLTVRPLDAPCQKAGDHPPPAPGPSAPTAPSRPGRPGRPPRAHPTPVPRRRDGGGAGPSYPWSRGRDSLYCVQHGGEGTAEWVPYPIMVHDEGSHPAGDCRGPGHDAPGTAAHILARSPIAAVGYALGEGEQRARYWWERGWIQVEGVPLPQGAMPPPGGIIPLRRRLWHDPAGKALLAPPGNPRPQARHYPLIQWCVRAPKEAESPFPAQIHACQDHRGQPCYPPAPWLPQQHHHLHIVAKSPAGALSRALGVARKTAKKLAKREGALLLEGETAYSFAAGKPPPPPSSPPPAGDACCSKGIAISVNLEAPWSCR